MAMMMASHMDAGDGDDCIVQGWHLSDVMPRSELIHVLTKGVAIGTTGVWAAHHLAAKKQNRWMINWTELTFEQQILIVRVYNQVLYQLWTTNYNSWANMYSRNAAHN